jgi:hypothetical protein
MCHHTLVTLRLVIVVFVSSSITIDNKNSIFIIRWININNNNNNKKYIHTQNLRGCQQLC